MLKAPLNKSLLYRDQASPDGIGDVDSLRLNRPAIFGIFFDSDPLLDITLTEAAATAQIATATLVISAAADQVIDATEARSVAFTVSGLNPGAIGVVTL